MKKCVSVFVSILLLVSSLMVALGNDESTVQRAVFEAKKLFEGIPYSWETGSHCSTYAAEYLRNLGYTTVNDDSRLSAYVPSSSDPIPGANTFKQSKWLINQDEALGGGYFQKVLVSTFAAGILDMKEGSLVYFETADSSNGFDTVSHVAIYTGLTDKVPTFSDFARGMKNGPMEGRLLSEIVNSMYYRDSSGTWDFLATNQTDELSVYIFDVVGMGEKLGLVS